MIAFIVVFPLLYMFVFGPLAQIVCDGWHGIFIGGDSYPACMWLPHKMGVI